MTTLKYITVPPAVALLAGKLEYSLRELVAHFVDNAAAFQRPTSAARAGARVLAAFETAEVVELREDDWKLLHDVAENPDCGFPAWNATDAAGKTSQLSVPARLYLPLLDAIDCATNSPPAKKPVEPAPATPESPASAV